MKRCTLTVYADRNYNAGFLRLLAYSHGEESKESSVKTEIMPVVAPGKRPAGGGASGDGRD